MSSRFFAKATTIAIPSLGVAGGYYHRPLPDFGDDRHWGGPAHYPPNPATEQQLKDCKQPFFSGDDGGLLLGFGQSVARYTVLNVINFVIRLGMNYNIYNKFHVVDDDRYKDLLKCIENRKTGEALLTVSNHCSTIDDPTLFGALTPPSVVMSPLDFEKMRYSLCSQEICFKNGILASFFGSGKVMPIKRGGGIQQLLLLKFALKVADGEWVHVFPEGKVVQSGTLGANYFGTRSPARADEIGKLKWGVGKLIAHSPVPIIVIPFHHVGMECIVPQKETSEPLHKYPQGGCDVTLQVGDRILFDDILEKHERSHGPLYKYGRSPRSEDESRWIESGNLEHERQLYSDIARRIEVALENIERESRCNKKDS